MRPQPRQLLAQARLAVITDTLRARGRSVDQQARLLTAAGAPMILLRAPGLAPAVYAGVARRARRLVPGHTLLGVYDHPELAAELGAAVHLGANDTPVAQARRAFPPLVIGYSAHSLDEARRAFDDGADYVFLSLLFTTAKDGHVRPPLPPGVWREAAALPGPVFALGGVSAQNLAAARRLGVDRVAVCGAVVGAENPAASLYPFLPCRLFSSVTASP